MRSLKTHPGYSWHANTQKKRVLRKHPAHKIVRPNRVGMFQHRLLGIDCQHFGALVRDTASANGQRVGTNVEIEPRPPIVRVVLHDQDSAVLYVVQ